MRFYIYFLLTATILSMNSCFKYQSEKADLIVHNAKIHQVNDAFSTAEAMAINDGKIIAIGPEHEIRNKYYSDHTIDAMKRVIFPGFIDPHSHMMMYAKSLAEVNLVGSKSWEEVLQRTLNFRQKNTDGWILGRGWDQNIWMDKRFPNKDSLDSLFPNTPVLLWRIDAHAAIANSKALELAGIDAKTIVEGGKVIVEDGETTGLLLDMAIEKVKEAIPPLSSEKWHMLIKRAEDSCFSKGLTTVSEAMMEAEHVKVLQELEKEGKLKIKIYGMLVPSEENKELFLENGPYRSDQLSISAFKYFADGALGSRGAKLKEEYSDDPGNTGIFLNDSAFLHEEALVLYEKNFQMATHCIGDAANFMVLSIYAEVLKTTNDRRWRIEHAQVVSPEDLEKFGKYNIIPSVQPSHATSDMAWAQERLGWKRLPYAYRLKELLEENGLIALGTDFPIEDIDPLKTFYSAVFRKKPNTDADENGFQMENAISRENALRGMTIWAAIANFEENEKGSLEVGKDADFIILDRDILQVKDGDILDAKVISTYVDGKKVYGAN